VLNLITNFCLTSQSNEHVQSGVIMTGDRVKKRQCVTVKLLATVPILLCENNGQEEKTSCQPVSIMVYVK